MAIEIASVKDQMVDAIKEVFETMIFMDVKECSCVHSVTGDALLTSITFTGEFEGCLTISCGNLCAKDIAKNMLCMDTIEEVSEEDTFDAFGEVANMVMGSIKSRMQSDFGSMDVSIPSVISGVHMAGSMSDSSERLALSLQLADEHTCEFVFMYRKSG